MDTQQTLTAIDPEYLEPVNDLLRFLVQRADPDYRAVMEATLSNRELESNQRKLDDALEAWGLPQPVGAIPAGTGITKDEAGFEGESGQELIRILKATGRLQQCGKGRGKCLLILSDEPLEDPRTAATQVEDTDDAGGETTDDAAPTPTPGAHDVRMMLRSIDAEMTNMLRERDDLRREVRMKSIRVEELEAALADYEHQVNELRNELDQRYATTWN